MGPSINSTLKFTTIMVETMKLQTIAVIESVYDHGNRDHVVGDSDYCKRKRNYSNDLMIDSRGCDY